MLAFFIIKKIPGAVRVAALVKFFNVGNTQAFYPHQDFEMPFQNSIYHLGTFKCPLARQLLLSIINKHKNNFLFWQNVGHFLSISQTYLDHIKVIFWAFLCQICFKYRAYLGHFSVISWACLGHILVISCLCLEHFCGRSMDYLWHN